ncbi:AraC family transcriptional regulator [Adhaeribacter aquaticus]|uniref:AraC family transcriptional regulator n=1 Tax=Adhaeribacter aquaticus TaxID=299567 RepID=UPI000425F59D|nr:AraC family transcriptional regulator [Adhaeribacter aquaticus]
MKPQLLKLSPGPAHSFSAREDKVPFINNRWHYHPEVELVHFHHGTGTQFVGDHISRFNTGDIVLVGANLPHYWRFDESYLEEIEEEKTYATAIHFTENFWGEEFLLLPENQAIRTILEKAKRGLVILEGNRKKIAQLIQKVHVAEGPFRIMALVECLTAIAHSDQLTPLSSMGFQAELSEPENDRLNAIYDYTFENFKSKISLTKIADVARLMPNSFCRYFKVRTGKTYSQFLIEIRIGYACKLLIQNKLPIKHLCFESGFNNFTCFHKNFKAITGKTPQIYQQEYLKQ